jgi:uncharacterized protein YdaT
MPKKDDVHVVPRDGGWAVRREKAERDSSHHPTQEKAIERAREIARRDGLEVVIHGRDGKIRDSDSYGRDPSRPKDTKF